MLYSARALQGVGVVTADQVAAGRLVDAYADVVTAAVAYLVVGERGAQTAPPRLCPPSDIREYDVASGRLVLGLDAGGLAARPPAPEGIPVTLPGPRGAGPAALHVVSQALGFAVDATDGTVGVAADFLIDAEGFAIRYLVVAPTDRQPGGEKLIPFEWLYGIDWARGRVQLRIGRRKTLSCQRAAWGSHVAVIR